MKPTWGTTMLVLGAGVATFAIAPAYRYGAWQDPSAVVMVGGLVLNYGAGLQTALLHVAKLAFVASFVPAWRRSKWAGLMCVSICVPLVLLSVWNAVALLALQRSARVTDERAASERAVMVRSELKSVGERLALIGWKARGTVEAEIAAERLRWTWDTTSGCTNVSSGGHRQFCAQVARLEGERVAAIEAEHLRAREAELRRDVASQPVGAESRHPDLIMLAEWLGISLDTAEVSRTLWWAGVVELVEIAAFGFAGFFWATTREDKSEVCIATSAPPERELTLATSMASTAPPPSRRVQPEAEEGGKVTAGDLGGAYRRARPGLRGGATRYPAGRDKGEECRAVDEFIGGLRQDPVLRASGSDLFDAYSRMREPRGWPAIPQNEFGRLIKSAVEARGGRKARPPVSFTRESGLSHGLAPMLRPSLRRRPETDSRARIRH